MADSLPGKITPIDQSWIARLSSGLRYAFTGRQPDGWFGPGSPIAPAAQEEAHGRQFDYPSAYNLQTRPRAYEPIDFATLRALADSYDMLRLAIETRKDQMAKLSWHIEARPGQTGSESDINRITDFLGYPDKLHTWDGWIRMIVEDLLVIDAPTIYPNFAKSGELYALYPMDGATIKPIIDVYGRMPLPPDPAYAQVLKGLPATYYTADELLYQPRNVRTYKTYGYSPVEQIVSTVNIALRRQMSQLQYYTEGNVPEAIVGVPTTWNPDQIKQFQLYWDGMLEGNTAQRRHMKFVPGGMDVHMTKEAELKGEYDEWLARVICYAFSLEPTPFIKQMNRAVAETVRQQALEEGLLPMQKHIKSLHDFILIKYFKMPNLQFLWDEEESIDPLIQAQINRIYLGPTAIVMRPSEVRTELGLEPDPELDEPPAAVPVDSASNEGGDDQIKPSSPDGFAADGSAATKIEKKKKFSASRVIAY